MLFDINGIEWLVVLVDANDPILLMPDGSRTIGVTDLQMRTIYIANNLDDYMLHKCVMHEMCHVLADMYNLGVNIPNEECVCHFLEDYGDDLLYYGDKIYELIIGI